jgi:hypothetical protein
MSEQNQHARQFHEILRRHGLRPAESRAEDFDPDRRLELPPPAATSERLLANMPAPVDPSPAPPEVDPSDWNQSRADLT